MGFIIAIVILSGFSGPIRHHLDAILRPNGGGGITLREYRVNHHRG
jgi:hypothetical protein